MDIYKRFYILKSIGKENFEKLREKSISIVGAGALGSNISLGLARIGFKKIKIIDYDVVEEENLSVQNYEFEDLKEGKPKVFALKEKIGRINPEIEVNAIHEELNPKNAINFLRDTDIIIDATDNFDTRFLINEVSYREGIPWVHGAVIEERGEAGIFVPEKTACYRCFLPNIPKGYIETCEIMGVHPSIVNFVAGFQINLAIKYLLGEKLPENRIYYFDLSDFTFNYFEFEKRKDCPVCSKKEFPFLMEKEGFNVWGLCGGGTVQMRLEKKIDIEKLEKILKNFGECILKPYFLRFKRDAFEIMFFKDGKVYLKGKDMTKEKARVILKKYLGI